MANRNEDKCTKEAANRIIEALNESDSCSLHDAIALLLATRKVLESGIKENVSPHLVSANTAVDQALAPLRKFESEVFDNKYSTDKTDD